MRRTLAAWGVQLLRVGLLAAIVGVIHWQYVRAMARSQARGLAEVPLERVQAIFPAAKRLGEAESHGGMTVLDEKGQPLGYVIQTAPESDPYLGFSGPTNCLIGFDPAGQIAGVAIINSRDTREHVDLIVRHAKFLKSWDRLTGPQAAQKSDLDGVAGATLTSLAIAQGLQRRLGATTQASKFPKELTVADAQQLFKTAAAVQVDAELPSLWHVNDERGRELGLILRTTPAADEVIGYQGPTETRIGIRPGGDIVAVVVGPSFDNQPYVTYVREDGYYLAVFRRLGLEGLAELDLKAAGVEGVTGATMTSMAVARGIVKAAADYEAAKQKQITEIANKRQWQWRTAATLSIIAFGVVMGLTRLRGIAWLRIGFQMLLIGYLGLTSAELLSLAMFGGWGQSGVPWRNATGLAALTAAAVALPITQGRNVYCSHLCPHGAAQQLLPRWWQVGQMPAWLGKMLRLIRPALLAWVVIVAVGQLPFSLVNIEPFDAYSWRAAAWPTTTVAIVGLVASLFVPMAYCRFGCPTGAVLNYLRMHARSDRLTRADWFAVGCLVMAIVLLLLPPGEGARP